MSKRTLPDNDAVTDPFGGLSQNFAERAVFNYIVSRFEVSTPELASYTGMPGSTISGILNRLISRGLVAPSGTEGGQRGRPSIRYQLLIPRPIYACQLDATQVSVSVLDCNLRVLALQVQTFSRIRSLSAAAEAIRDASTRLRSSMPKSIAKPSELALALNAISPGRRDLLSSVLPWAEPNSEKALAEMLSMPVKIVSPVVSLLAEKQKLPHPVPETFVRFQVGDGVSAHIAIAGETYYGHSYLAGELGHIIIDPNGPLCGCGRRGCLEAYCGGPALHEQILRDLAPGVSTGIEYEKIVRSSPRVSIGILWEAWKRGDAYAQDFMRRVFDRLASSLGILMNLLDPELILISGYVLENHPEWIEEIRRRAEQWAFHAPLRPIPLRAAEATLEDELRVTGALYFYRVGEKQSRSS
jgi:N-acetylglucosamine repressor